MYDSVATLKGNPQATYDEYLNEVITYTDTQVYVMPRSVYQSEFYNASQVGLHPSITFELTHRDDYHDEKLIEWNNKLYNIIRVDWNGQRDKLSLVCEERVSNG